MTVFRSTPEVPREQRERDASALSGTINTLANPNASVEQIQDLANGGLLRRLQTSHRYIREHLSEAELGNLRSLHRNMDRYIREVRGASTLSPTRQEELVAELTQLRTELAPTILRPGEFFQAETQEVAQFARDNPGAVTTVAAVAGAGIVATVFFSVWNAFRHPVQTAQGAGETIQHGWSTFWRGVLLTSAATSAAALATYLGWPKLQDIIGKISRQQEQRKKQEEVKAKGAEQNGPPQAEKKGTQDQQRTKNDAAPPEPNVKRANEPVTKATRVPTGDADRKLVQNQQELDQQNTKQDALPVENQASQPTQNPTTPNTPSPTLETVADPIPQDVNLLGRTMEIAPGLNVKIEGNPLVIIINGVSWRAGLETVYNDYDSVDGPRALARNTGRFFGNRGRQVAGAAGRFAVDRVRVTDARWTGSGFRISASVLGITFPRPGRENEVVPLDEIVARARRIAAASGNTIEASQLFDADAMRQIPIPASQRFILRRAVG